MSNKNETNPLLNNDNIYQQPPPQQYQPQFDFNQQPQYNQQPPPQYQPQQFPPYDYQQQPPQFNQPPPQYQVPPQQFQQPQYDYNQQYQQQNPIIIVQPTTTTVVYDQVCSGPTTWSIPLCGCCSDCGVCCTSLWCFSCQECKLRAATHGRASCGCEDFCVPCLCYSFLGPIGALFVRCSNRTEVRRRLNINGDGCSDCLCSWCCTFCTQVQEVREMNGRGVQSSLCS
eukprot:TRINITY_DN10831_c1_g1_i1.p1 TRINITY_DN10831_c1_g1~~TRINITY_DN10831_c1_g1_i1.p1  ORF type:complete len:228 (-),score=56.86 TRINITY_DN10831_c1_g1_i1:68-751(-)